MKHICIDYGQRRIGIAVSDPLGMIVRPVYTIDRQVEKTYPKLKEIFETENPEIVIFGLPLDSEGEENDLCREIRAFSKKLYEKLNISLPCDFQDESYSSVRTHSLLLANSKKKKRSNKKNIDKIAACIILEDYIKEHSGTPYFY